MSPTATPSDATPARRTRWAPRWLVVLHRYLGVVMGLPMLLWCLSGVVMLFVHYPSVGEDERLSRLAPINWSQCCRFGETLPNQAPVLSAAIEDLGGAPILRLRLADDGPRMVDLATGRGFNAATLPSALSAATAFGDATPKTVTRVERDQWTVSGEFNRGRPFWRVRLADPAGTDIYVSQKSGQVVQRTTAVSRVLNWFGAVPHWLYPQVLRQDVKLWSQVVIWTSLTGAFLTVVGLYLGLLSWRPFGDRRLSPYRGLMTWHHLTGLATGVLTLTWVASGLFSMNPWGFLESPPSEAHERIVGPPPPLGAVREALAAVAAQAPVVGQVRLAPLNGAVFIMAGDTRFDAQGAPAPLGAGDLTAAGLRTGPVAAQGLLRTEDAYYFSHHDKAPLPVWRVIAADGERHYLDPHTGRLLGSFDGQAKGYRWLHLGLHRLDFIPGIRQGPVWAILMVLLMAGVTFGVGTGVWLALERLRHDFGRLRGRWR